MITVLCCICICSKLVASIPLPEDSARYLGGAFGTSGQLHNIPEQEARSYARSRGFPLNSNANPNYKINIQQGPSVVRGHLNQYNQPPPLLGQGNVFKGTLPDLTGYGNQFNRPKSTLQLSNSPSIVGKTISERSTVYPEKKIPVLREFQNNHPPGILIDNLSENRVPLKRISQTVDGNSNGKISLDLKQQRQFVPETSTLSNIRNENQHPTQIKLPPGHSVQDILHHPEIRKFIESKPKQKKRYLVIYPNGVVERVDDLQPIANKYPNYLLMNGADAIRNLPNTQQYNRYNKDETINKVNENNIDNQAKQVKLNAKNTPEFNDDVKPKTIQRPLSFSTKQVMQTTKAIIPSSTEKHVVDLNQSQNRNVQNSKVESRNQVANNKDLSPPNNQKWQLPPPKLIHSTSSEQLTSPKEQTWKASNENSHSTAKDTQSKVIQPPTSMSSTVYLSVPAEAGSLDKKLPSGVPLQQKLNLPPLALKTNPPDQTWSKPETTKNTEHALRIIDEHVASVLPTTRTSSNNVSKQENKYEAMQGNSKNGTPIPGPGSVTEIPVSEHSQSNVKDAELHSKYVLNEGTPKSVSAFSLDSTIDSLIQPSYLKSPQEEDESIENIIKNILKTIPSALDTSLKPSQSLLDILSTQKTFDPTIYNKLRELDTNSKDEKKIEPLDSIISKLSINEDLHQKEANKKFQKAEVKKIASSSTQTNNIATTLKSTNTKQTENHLISSSPEVSSIQDIIHPQYQTTDVDDSLKSITNSASIVPTTLAQLTTPTKAYEKETLSHGKTTDETKPTTKTPVDEVPFLIPPTENLTNIPAQKEISPDKSPQVLHSVSTVMPVHAATVSEVRKEAIGIPNQNLEQVIVQQASSSHSLLDDDESVSKITATKKPEEQFYNEKNTKDLSSEEIGTSLALSEENKTNQERKLSALPERPQNNYHPPTAEDIKNHDSKGGGRPLMWFRTSDPNAMDKLLDNYSGVIYFFNVPSLSHDKETRDKRD